mmetsp:Transcript_57682/g.146315  ORF Transcript_57682/g.146315 Transcript_57682/m.146315 type:complete len:200 (-) Transcript_57682:94-693(-)
MLAWMQRHHLCLGLLSRVRAHRAAAHAEVPQRQHRGGVAAEVQKGADAGIHRGDHASVGRPPIGDQVAPRLPRDGVRVHRAKELAVVVPLRHDVDGRLLAELKCACEAAVLLWKQRLLLGADVEERAEGGNVRDPRLVRRPPVRDDLVQPLPRGRRRSQREVDLAGVALTGDDVDNASVTHLERVEHGVVHGLAPTPGQ